MASRSHTPSIRLFRCANCGHRLRFFGKTCSVCDYPRDPLQRGGVWLWLVVAILLLVFALLILAG